MCLHRWFHFSQLNLWLTLSAGSQQCVWSLQLHLCPEVEHQDSGKCWRRGDLSTSLTTIMMIFFVIIVVNSCHCYCYQVNQLARNMTSLSTAVSIVWALALAIMIVMMIIIIHCAQQRWANWSQKLTSLQRISPQSGTELGGWEFIIALMTNATDITSVRDGVGRVIMIMLLFTSWWYMYNGEVSVCL